MITLTADDTRSTTHVSAWFSWTMIALGWGLTYHWMAVGAEWAPLPFIALRHTTGVVVLLAMSAVLYPGSAERRVAGRLTLVGVLMWAIGNGLLIWSLQPSGLNEGRAALVVATIPLCTGWLAGFGARGKRLTLLSCVTLIVGIAGAFLTLIDYQPHAAGTAAAWPLAPGSPVHAILGLILGVLSWSCGSVVLARTVPSPHPIWSAGIQMLGGGLCLLVALAVSLVVRGDGVPPITGDVVSALLLVTLVGSVLCPACYVHAVKHLPVTVVALHAYLNPLVALAVDAYPGGTGVRWPTLVGAVVVLGAVAFASRLEIRRHS
jgi:drug/metabolite transporter (DMT)-like permease